MPCLASLAQFWKRLLAGIISKGKPEQAKDKPEAPWRPYWAGNVFLSRPYVTVGSEWIAEWMKTKIRKRIKRSGWQKKSQVWPVCGWSVLLHSSHSKWETLPVANQHVPMREISINNIQSTSPPLSDPCFYLRYLEERLITGFYSAGRFSLS